MLRNKLFPAVAAVLLVLASATGHAEQLLREFNGTGSTITSEFEVQGPWLLDWRVNGDYSEVLLAIDVVLLDGRTGRNEGLILHTKRAGNGVKLFNSGGRYKLRVDASLARWSLKVIQISAAEAEQYTPRKNN